MNSNWNWIIVLALDFISSCGQKTSSEETPKSGLIEKNAWK